MIFAANLSAVPIPTCSIPNHSERTNRSSSYHLLPKSSCVIDVKASETASTTHHGRRRLASPSFFLTIISQILLIGYSGFGLVEVNRRDYSFFFFFLWECRGSPEKGRQRSLINLILTPSMFHHNQMRCIIGSISWLYSCC